MGRSIKDIVNEHITANRTQLPVFDGTSRRIQEMLESPEFDVTEIERLIASDPVIAAALLRVANSSFYGGLEKVTSPSEALLRLGAKQVAKIVLLVGQKQSYRLRDAKLAPLVNALWHHAVGCALGAEWLAKRLRRTDVAGDVFMAGLLHDIGKLFLLRVLDDLKAANASFKPAEPLVRELMASMHGEQGARLLESWNIPELFCGIARHHHDDEVDERNTALLLVRLVNVACNKLGIGLEDGIDLDLAALEEAQILRVGDVLAAELEICLEDAAELAAA
jgi:HD-like signal output (HDOD) protein